MLFVMEMLAIFMASIFFWPVMLVIFIFLWSASEREQVGWSVVFTATLGGLMYLKFPGAFDRFMDPIFLLMVLGGYVVAGVTWASLKWVLHCKSMFRKFVEIRDDYLQSHKLPSGYFTSETVGDIKMFNDHNSKFASRIYDKLHHLGVRGIGTSAISARDAVIPKIGENKLRYTLWGVYWPTSIVWFICNDFVRELANQVYDMVSGRMQKIANGIFRDAL